MRLFCWDTICVLRVGERCAAKGNADRPTASSAVGFLPRRQRRFQPMPRFLFRFNQRGLLRQQQATLFLNCWHQIKPRRRFLFLSGERKRKSAEKRKKARTSDTAKEENAVRVCDAEKRRFTSPTAAESINPQCRQAGIALSSAVFGLQPCGHFSKDTYPHKVLRNAFR